VVKVMQSRDTLNSRASTMACVHRDIRITSKFNDLLFLQVQRDFSITLYNGTLYEGRYYPDMVGDYS
jgi:hypothetical protein